jgi:voltage-gated potassium channel
VSELAAARRRRFEDGLALRLALAAHVARKLGPWLVAAIGYTLVAAFVFRWDLARHGRPVKDFGATLYALYTQLFFEPTEDFPTSPIARTLFWITPVVGAVVVAEGVLKVGGALVDREARRELWTRLRSQRMKDHVVVCGLGNVGFRVVNALVDLGEAVVAIERNASSFVESVEHANIPVIRGDARRDELLIEAGIERARTVVCATDDDLANLEVAIDARRMNPKIRVVMRMFDQRMASKVGGALEFDRTFSTSAVTAPLVALQARWDGVRAVYPLDDGTLRVSLEMRVGSQCPAKTVGALEEALDVRVVAATVNGGPLTTARASTPLAAGDRVLVDAPAPLLPQIAAYLH